MRDGSMPLDLRAALVDFVRGIGGTDLLVGVMPPTGASRKEQTDRVLLDVWPATRRIATNDEMEALYKGECVLKEVVAEQALGFCLLKKA